MNKLLYIITILAVMEILLMFVIFWNYGPFELQSCKTLSTANIE